MIQEGIDSKSVGLPLAEILDAVKSSKTKVNLERSTSPRIKSKLKENHESKPNPSKDKLEIEIGSSPLRLQKPQTPNPNPLNTYKKCFKNQLLLLNFSG